MRYTLGSLILPSHISNWQIDTPIENDISFWGRLVNFWLTWKQIYYWTNFYAPMEDALARKHLGPDIPYIDDITKNMSVYLVNRHPLLSHSRPEQANIVLFYSFHLEKKMSPLPEVYIRIYLHDYLLNFFLTSQTRFNNARVLIICR